MKDRSELQGRIRARKTLKDVEVVEPDQTFKSLLDEAEEEQNHQPSRAARNSRVKIADIGMIEDDPEAVAEAICSGVKRDAPPSFVVDDEIDDDMTVFGNETEGSDTAKAIEALLGNGDFRTKTDLSKEEVRALAVLIEISEKFKAKRLRDFAENFMALMISYGRGSRKEVVQSFSGMEYFGRGRGGAEGQPTTPFRAQ